MHRCYVRGTRLHTAKPVYVSVMLSVGALMRRCMSVVRSYTPVFAGYVVGGSAYKLLCIRGTHLRTAKPVYVGYVVCGSPYAQFYVGGTFLHTRFCQFCCL